MRVIIPAFLLAITPALAGAQQASATVASEASVRATPAASVETTGDAVADARIEGARTRVQHAGLSDASLVNRVELGRARGVSAVRIAAAVESRATALIEARDALRASVGTEANEAVEVGADAIESGARASDVAAVAARFEGSERTRAIAVLSGLAAESALGADVVASVRQALAADAASASGSATAAATGTLGGASAGTVVTGAATASGDVAGSAASAGGGVSGVVRSAVPR